MAALLVAVREANLSAGQWFILTAASIISAPFFIPLLKRKERNCHLHCEGSAKSMYWSEACTLRRQGTRLAPAQLIAEQFLRRCQDGFD